MRIPKGLVKCEVCGDYKGAARIGDLSEIHPPRHRSRRIAVGCKCDWIICRQCGVNKRRGPGNWYDPLDNKVWHSSWVNGFFGCESCRETSLAPRPFEPVKIIPAKNQGNFNWNDRSLDAARQVLVLLTSTEAGEVVNGMFYLVGGRIIVQPQTRADRQLIEDVLKKPHPVGDTEVPPEENPEAWFHALPSVYDGTSFSTMTVVRKFFN